MKSLVIFLSLLSFHTYADDNNAFKASSDGIHQIKLFNHGLSAFEERLEMIERAKKSIDIEYFIYSLDRSGRIFSQALIKKAKEGVKVRILLDYFLVKNEFSPFYAHEMEKFGIEVKYYNTTKLIKFSKAQYRNHRKVVIIDGVEAITGGRNIADEYFDLNDKYNFLDRDLEVKGPIVPSIQKTFDVLWENENSVKVDREKMPRETDAAYNIEDYVDNAAYQRDLSAYENKVAKAVEFLSVIDESLLSDIRQKGKTELLTEYSGTCENMKFYSELPIIGKKNRSLRNIKFDIADRMSNAKESILFDSPYFILENELKDGLMSALNKNLDVKVLTNSLNSTDAIYAYSAFDTVIKKWIKNGLQTYIYKGTKPENYEVLTDTIGNARFGVHAKSFIFDRKDVVIGTFNFDPRSANLNAEMTISCDNNPELANKVTEDIEARMKNSIHLDSNKAVNKAQFYKTSFLKDVTYYLLKIPANIFANLL